MKMLALQCKLKRTEPLALRGYRRELMKGIACLAVILLAGSALPAGAQRPPAAVGYTEARRHQIRQSLTLPGEVATDRTSLVASEISGLVEEFPVRDGDRIEKGQLLARLRTRSREIELAATEAQLKEAEARRKLAERNFQRARELFDSGVFSRQQFDDTRYELNAWEGRVENLKSQIERIRYDIESSAIKAPFSGVVVARHTEVGQWLGVGDAVVELLSLDELVVEAEVPEQYFEAIRPGAPASVRFDALAGRTVRGRISAVIPKADEQARTFPVRIRVPSDGLAVGLLAQVRLDGVSRRGASARAATVVPKDAVVRRGPQTLVYVLDGDGTAKPVPVQLGAAAGDWVEVKGPIAPGAKVITRGNERLRPGQKVQGRPVEYPAP